eukprot:COSAG02_NODE_50211_length_322_cov_0.587444_2_plen_29_part_01
MILTAPTVLRLYVSTSRYRYLLRKINMGA